MPASRQPYYRSADQDWPATPAPVDVTYSVILVGDTGLPTLPRDPVLQLLDRQMRRHEARTTVVFLGDNVYPRGLPPEGHRLRAVSEQRLRAQLDLFANFAGRVHFLSGNHDWNRGRPDGLEYLKRQEDFVNDVLRRPDCFLPTGGTPGPATVPLGDDARLVVLNTQWWVQRGDRPEGPRGAARTEADALRLLDQTLTDHAPQPVVVVGHHPLYSNALHGGRFTARHHVFPLTAIHRKLLVPLPVAGSLFPLYRRLFGAREDMAHPRYRRLRKALLGVLGRHQNLIYAAGHDHNLQYFEQGTRHFLVSGAGSKASFVHGGGKAAFTYAHRGFFRLDFTPGGQTWLTALVPHPDQPDGQVVYRKRLAMNALSANTADQFSTRTER